MNHARLLLVAVIALSSALASAETSVSRAQLPTPESSISAPGWKPFVGISSGYMSKGGDANVQGVPSNIKALGSYYTEKTNWVFDIGGGLQHQAMTNNDNATLPVIEASARHRWGQGWQAGPIVNTYLGNSDRYSSANKNFTSFIGGAIDKEFKWENQLVRAGATALTDLDVRDAQAYAVMANLQLGFGSAVQKQSEPVAEAAPAPAAEHLIKQAQATQVGPQKPLAHFALNSADLTTSDRQYLNRVASLLKLNAKQIDRVTLVGHTDVTGTEKLNEKLSIQRAQSVRSYLIKQGVPATKLAVAGRSSRDPISKQLEPNRRVEVKLGNKAPTQLENALRSIE